MSKPLNLFCKPIIFCIVHYTNCAFLLYCCGGIGISNLLHCFTVTLDPQYLILNFILFPILQTKNIVNIFPLEIDTKKRAMHKPNAIRVRGHKEKVFFYLFGYFIRKSYQTVNKFILKISIYNFLAVSRIHLQQQVLSDNPFSNSLL